MALTEETLNDKIEVVNNGTFTTVQVRTADVIKRDGEEISRSFHRHVVMPDADLSAEDDDVAAICTHCGCHQT
jgi:Rieske Fe-S protein